MTQPSSKRLVTEASLAPAITNAVAPIKNLSDPTLSAALSATIAAQVATEQTRADAAYARAGAIVRPVLPSTSPTVQLLSGSTGNTTAGTFASATTADATDFVMGTSAAKITTNTTGSSTWHQQTVTWDMTGKMLRLFLKVDSWTTLADVKVYCADSTFTSYYIADIDETWVARTSSRVWREGEWCIIDVPRGEFTVGAGTPNWAAIGYVRILISPVNGQTGVVHYNGCALVAEPSALPNGAVVFTFDDSDSSQFTIAKPYLDKYGAAGTLFPISANVDAAGLTAAQIKQMRDFSGWEIGVHAWDNTEHAAGMTGLDATTLRTKFDRLKTWAAANGFASNSYAWPNGDSDTVSETVAREYFASARGITPGTQAASFPSPMRIKARGINGYTQAQGKAAIDAAKAGKGLCYFVTHRIVAASPTGLDTLTADFQAIVDYAVAQGVPMLTQNGALKALGKV